MLASHMMVSAVHYAELLYRKTRLPAHGLLYARCYFLANEKRRCLGVLEQLGYLNLEEGSIPFYENNSEGSVDQLLFACSANLLAAQCLFDLEQFEDCVALLDPFMITIDSRIISDKGLSSLRLEPSSSEGMVVASLHIILGKSHDALDNRSRAFLSLTKSIRTSPFVIEAVEFIVDRSLFTPSQKMELLAEVEQSLSKKDTWLLEQYRYSEASNTFVLSLCSNYFHYKISFK